MTGERLDPWGSGLVKDYEGIMQEFGIKNFAPLLSNMRNPLHLMRRGIIFGHRDFDKYLESMRSGKYALLTGFMPTGSMHFGSKMVADEIIWFQELGAEVFIPIADIEAYSVRRIPMSECRSNAISLIKDLIALGLKPDKCHIYFQSDYKPAYYRMEHMFGRRVTLNEFKALYGDEVTPAKMQSALLQAADILHPELDEFGGFKNVVVPVGIDQDVHIRLTRDLVDRSEFGLKPPASIYHRFMPGLDGGKMSKSRPDSVISLTESVKSGIRKLRNALDGGRDTAEEQKKLGGRPEKCMVFQMLKYHLVKDDKELEEWRDECRNGLLCGTCKNRAVKLLAGFLEEHKKRFDEAENLLPEFGIKP